MDFFVDKNLINGLIRKTCDNPEKYIATEKQVWVAYTKIMLKNYSVFEICNLMEQIIEEVSDEDWFEHKYPKDFFNENFIYPKKKRIHVPYVDEKIEKIVSKISIIGLADKYNLTPLGKSNRICPFHADKDPSLSLDDEKGLFHCFGCNVSGNIVHFKIMLDKIGGKNETQN